MTTLPPCPRPRRGLALLILPAVLAAGCSGEPTRGPVTGVVTLDGKPLPNVMVMFVPDPGHGTPGQRSVALTDAAGRYAVFTDKDQEGASVGIHRVSLCDPLSYPTPQLLVPAALTGKKDAPTSPPAPSPAPPPSRVPAKYTDTSKTPLQPVTIGRDAQTYDIHLKSK